MSKFYIAVEPQIPKQVVLLMQLDKSLEAVEDLLAPLFSEHGELKIDSRPPVKARRLHAGLVISPPRPSREDLDRHGVVIALTDVVLIYPSIRSSMR